MIRTRVVVAAAFLCTTAAALPGQSLTTADRDFLVQAWQNSLAQISLGRLVVDKSGDPNVRSFAFRMMQDHSLIINDLRPYTIQAGGKEPEKLTQQQKDAYAALKAKSGISFDRAYVSLMVEQTLQTLVAYAKETARVKDPNLQPIMAKELPTVREHTQIIDGIAHMGGIPTPPIPPGL